MKTILLALMLVTGAAAAQDQYPRSRSAFWWATPRAAATTLSCAYCSRKCRKGSASQSSLRTSPARSRSLPPSSPRARAPDGYTIFMGPSGPMTINPATYSKLPYHPQRDFAPISMICEFPLIVTVDAKLPVKSVKELIDYAKANPGKSNYASSAGIFQITTELFSRRPAPRSR